MPTSAGARKGAVPGRPAAAAAPDSAPSRRRPIRGRRSSHKTSRWSKEEDAEPLTYRKTRSSMKGVPATTARRPATNPVNPVNPVNPTVTTTATSKPPAVKKAAGAAQHGSKAVDAPRAIRPPPPPPPRPPEARERRPASPLLLYSPATPLAHDADAAPFAPLPPTNHRPSKDSLRTSLCDGSAARNDRPSSAHLSTSKGELYISLDASSSLASAAPGGARSGSRWKDDSVPALFSVFDVNTSAQLPPRPRASANLAPVRGDSDSDSDGDTVFITSSLCTPQLRHNLSLSSTSFPTFSTAASLPSPAAERPVRAAPAKALKSTAAARPPPLKKSDGVKRASAAADGGSGSGSGNVPLPNSNGGGGAIAANVPALPAFSTNAVVLLRRLCARARAAGVIRTAAASTGAEAARPRPAVTVPPLPLPPRRAHAHATTSAPKPPPQRLSRRVQPTPQLDLNDLSVDDDDDIVFVPGTSPERARLSVLGSAVPSPAKSVVARLLAGPRGASASAARAHVRRHDGVIFRGKEGVEMLQQSYGAESERTGGAHRLPLPPLYARAARLFSFLVEVGAGSPSTTAETSPAAGAASAPGAAAAAAVPPSLPQTPLSAGEPRSTRVVDAAYMEDFFRFFFIRERWFTAESLVYALCLVNRLTRREPTWWKRDDASDDDDDSIKIEPDSQRNSPFQSASAGAEGMKRSKSDEAASRAIDDMAQEMMWQDGEFVPLFPSEADDLVSTNTAMFSAPATPRCFLALLLMASKFLDDLSYKTASLCRVMDSIRSDQQLQRREHHQLLLRRRAEAAARREKPQRHKSESPATTGATQDLSLSFSLSSGSSSLGSSLTWSSTGTNMPYVPYTARKSDPASLPPPLHTSTRNTSVSTRDDKSSRVAPSTAICTDSAGEGDAVPLSNSPARSSASSSPKLSVHSSISSVSFYSSELSDKGTARTEPQTGSNTSTARPGRQARKPTAAPAPRPTPAATAKPTFRKPSDGEDDDEDAEDTDLIANYPALRPERLGQCEQRLFRYLHYSALVKPAEYRCCLAALNAS